MPTKEGEKGVSIGPDPELDSGHIMEESGKICREYTGRAINFYKAFFRKG
ncbi:MAG: hypothetical protein AB1478_02560 [Nitrospirota bacterium]